MNIKIFLLSCLLFSFLTMGHAQESSTTIIPQALKQEDMGSIDYFGPWDNGYSIVITFQSSQKLLFLLLSGKNLEKFQKEDWQLGDQVEAYRISHSDYFVKNLRLDSVITAQKESGGWEGY